MIIIRLTLTVLILAAVAVANDAYEPIDTTNFANRADSYQGRLVAVSGAVVAIGADGKSIQIFDAATKALIEVRLLNLKKTQRNSLMLGPVRKISVYGKTEVRNGKLSITHTK
ncbi:MAG: hypothetical protein DMF69_18200 [Acidobacteria bacterium]|nr:MAG: hypothetical protein DMF69_18200 [Acidobacteriota bacterium]